MRSIVKGTRTQLTVSARYSGGRRDFGDSGLILPGGSGRPGQRQPQRIVLPGGQNLNPNREQRLFVPDDGPSNPQRGGSQMLDMPEPANAPVAGNRFRPPPGFMDRLPGQEAEPTYEPSELINKLRSRAGYWHQLAKFIPALNKLGYDSNLIDQETGLTPALQNKWVVGGTVWDTLSQSGLLEADVLDYFNSEGSEDLLCPFRFLGLDMRVAASKYIVDNRLLPQECDVLARAMKEWERRPTERYGFSEHPADCLAFKYLRDAGECRFTEEIVAKLEQALKTAVTDEAKARVMEVMQAEQAPEESVTSGATLTVLRLTTEEVGFRPLPLVGSLLEVKPEDLQDVPRARQSGPFGGFTLDGASASATWLTLPTWKALAMAVTPVAISVQDCATVPAIVASTGAKTEDDRRRVAGPALLVIDLGTSREEPQEDSLYVASSDGSRLRLVDGGQLKDSSNLTQLARVLFMCRPPKVETEVAADFLTL